MNSNFKFISLSKSLTPRQNSLYIHFKKYKIDFVYSNYKNTLIKLLDLFFQLIKLKNNFSKKLNFVVGNNNIFITLLIKLVFPRSYLIKDIGFFSFDIKELPLKYKLIYFISDLISIVISNQISFESHAQIKRFKKYKLFRFYQKKYITFYAIYGEVKIEKIINNQSIANQYKFFNSSRKINIVKNNYLLFRGKFNSESGIDLLSKYFIEFSNKNKNDLPLFILGNGPLQNRLIEELRVNRKNNIILISEYLSNKNLSFLIANSFALFGQFEDKNQRLKYTLPNKFFESMLNKKPYITPHYPSFDFLENNNVIHVLNDKTINKYDLPNELVNFFIEFRKYSYMMSLFYSEIVIIIPNGNFYEKIKNFNSRL